MTGMRWLERRRDLRRLKQRWLREYRGGAYVVLDQMDPNFIPPSGSLNPAVATRAATCTVCRQGPGNDCRHFVAR